MNEPAVIIRLDDSGPAYSPGEPLSGEYRVECVEAGQIRSIEVSVLWHTEGKGDEDLVVHEFWRRNVEEGQWIDPHRPERFSTTLPNSPLSYEGQIIKIRWCVRVRVFFTRGRELLGQKLFRMGEVPPVCSRLKPGTTRFLSDATQPPAKDDAEDREEHF